jgi:hypothetical protein
MVLSVIGIILCLGGLIGAWALNDTATEAATGMIETVNGYLEQAGQMNAQASARIANLTAEIEGIQQAVANTTAEDRAQFVERVTTRVEPVISGLRSGYTMLSSGLASLNQTLTTVNRMPGIEVPTLTDELAAIDQRLTTISNTVDALTSTVADVNVDGSRIEAAAATAAGELQSLEDTLAQWQTRIDATVAAAESAQAAVPGVLNWTSLAISLLAILFGGGQASLFFHALAWFRQL